MHRRFFAIIKLLIFIAKLRDLILSSVRNEHRNMQPIDIAR